MIENARSKANDGLAHGSVTRAPRRAGRRTLGALALTAAFLAAPSVLAGGQPAAAPPPPGDENKAPPPPAPPAAAAVAQPAAVAPVSPPAAAGPTEAPLAQPDVTPPPPPAPEKNELGPEDPIAGWSDGTAFLRSPGNNFVLFPSARLHTDLYLFKRPTPDLPQDSLLIRRARLELTGWIGSMIYWTLQGDFAAGPPAAADPVAQNWIATTDNYVAVAPFKDRMILQVGQYDAPFTLENRTSDKYIDFMERSLTVRSLGIPTNKEVGVMLHGQPLTNKAVYYALGAFNGDGQNFRNVDNNVDFMGRAWIAPLAFTSIEALKAITLGGSFWVGKRGATGLALANQSTQGGFTFMNSKWTLDDKKTSAELHQDGAQRAFAIELNVPIAHRFGARFEFVTKHYNLEEDDITGAASGKLLKLGTGTLDGTSFYAEAWGWIIGDDKIIGEPGLQLPTRLKKFTDPSPRHGLQVLFRIDNLNETIDSTLTNPIVGKDPNKGTIHVIAPEVGLNYWYSKRFRATFNYVANLVDGTAPTIDKAKAKLFEKGATVPKSGTAAAEHEFLFRLGIAL